MTITSTKNWRHALLQRLGRVTSGGRFIPEVDGFRFIAIWWVVLYHVHRFVLESHPEGPSGALGWVIARGSAGVQLFFVISGFVLALPFATHYLRQGPSISYKKYLLRRITRLEPTYVINLTLLFLRKVLIAGGSVALLWPHFLASLTYTHGLIYQDQSPINSLTWSLEIEVQFYLLAPLLCWGFRVRDPGLRRAMWVGAIVVLSGLRATHCLDGYLKQTLLHHLEYFLAGLLLADFYVSLKETEASVRTFQWDLLGLVGWAGVIAMAKHPYPFGMALVIAVAYAGSFRGRLLQKFFSNMWIAAFGGMCYTIYLWHPTFFWFFGKYAARATRSLGYEGALLGNMAIIIPVAVVSSAILFVLFEKPFMYRDWPERFAGLFRLRRLAVPRTVLEPAVAAAADEAGRPERK